MPRGSWAYHPLHRRHDAAVDEHRPLELLAAPERQVELARQVEVDLDRRERLFATLRILHLEVDLRAVERGLTFGFFVREAVRIEALAQHRLAAIPRWRRVAHVLPGRRTSREPVMQTAVVCQVAVRLADHSQDGRDLLADLIGRAEDVAVVQRHLTRRERPPTAPVHSRRDLSYRSLRQAAPGICCPAWLRREHEDVVRTVHRAQHHLLAAPTCIGGYMSSWYRFCQCPERSYRVRMASSGACKRCRSRGAVREAER